MTYCVQADGSSHPFPIEDDMGAYCEEHGRTILRHPPFVPEADMPAPPSAPSPAAADR